MIDLYRLSADLSDPRSDFRRDADAIIEEIQAILATATPRTREIIGGWQEEFRYLYGDAKGMSDDSKLKFFAIQTYFSMLLKVVMQEILAPGQEDFSAEEILLGAYAKQKGIRNYCCADWYVWPVFETEKEVKTLLDRMREPLAAYRRDMSAAEFVRDNRYDHLKQMYEAIIPRELRHALGEYYTPDWLAEETLATALSFGKTNATKRVIDPTCGSGTFLFHAIVWKRKQGLSLSEILRTVSGIDINPLAVFTAKTNYLLSVLDLIGAETGIEIPVYQKDVLKLGDECDFACAADLVIGNPPWVNWEYLPEAYRTQTKHLWTDYQLFAAKGRELSFAKEDISVLITCIAMDRLLKDGGILAFVIRQGVFKSAQNGTGFRKFSLKGDCGIKVLRADDLSRLKPFESAATSTAIAYLKKGEKTVYPVPYILWEKRKNLRRVSIDGYSTLSDVKVQVTLTEQKARPAAWDDLTSMWLTAEERTLRHIERVLGTNRYRARTGVFTGGANGVYWLEIRGRTGADLEISNLVERAKRKTEKVSRVIEPDYVFPMLKGSNVRRWRISYDTYLLCPHTAETKMWPVSGSVLEKTVPKTFDYLNYFRQELDQRRGFAGWEREIKRQEFHAILRVGEYTFSDYKVVWKYIASEFVCAVTGRVQDPFLGEKTLLPNEKIMYVSTNDEDEAYYLCGILSSTLIAECVKGYMNPTSISTHVLDKLNIPDFDPENPDHLEIAGICKAGHGKEDVSAYIEEIDRIVDRMYM